MMMTSALSALPLLNLTKNVDGPREKNNQAHMCHRHHHRGRPSRHQRLSPSNFQIRIVLERRGRRRRQEPKISSMLN